MNRIMVRFALLSIHLIFVSWRLTRDFRDELKVGDQLLVKVLSIAGNNVRLSRKALIKEAREKQQNKDAGSATD